MSEVEAMSSFEAWFVVATFIVLFIGYIINLNKLVKSDYLTGLVVARTVGVAIFPLGALMGFFY